MQVLENNKTTLAFVTIWGEGERNFEFALDADQKISFAAIKDSINDFDIFHFGSATSLLAAEPCENYNQILEATIAAKNLFALIQTEETYYEKMMLNNFVKK
ncbi:sucrose-6-phosphate hydrolase [Spiroplasma clarkii]|uniref:hypothetical protein n=1 Tax=Spiroplasma clarkii TaxID=2139 RepID=UPI000B57F3A9|nr:hypothetical protein [Spiroplasma clarkii]ARU91630.1 sucrose-6-phosphate hydrolase [Spiroplasma clarkii]